MQDIASQLKAVMRERGLSQMRLANEASVSQSTVCRALDRIPGRHSAAFERLCNYAGISHERKDDSMTTGVSVINAAFMSIWDRTDRQAMAIAKIIEDLGNLDPSRKQPLDEQNEQ
jgi:hypothetical protein